MMSEELDFTPPEDDPEYSRYEYDANVGPPGQDNTLVTIYCYDCEDRLTARDRPRSPR